jgi:hypothetical protein
MSTRWVSMTRSYIENCVMDTVFRVYDPVAKKEAYLLEDWGATKETEICSWVQTLQTGILNEDGMPLPICTFDGDNLAHCNSCINLY